MSVVSKNDVLELGQQVRDVQNETLVLLVEALQQSGKSVVSVLLGTLVT